MTDTTDTHACDHSADNTASECDVIDGHDASALQRRPLAPITDMKPFTPTTRAVLDRLTELGLNPTFSHQWQYPTPSMSVHFGIGSGWVWGDLCINGSGQLSDLRVRWYSCDGRERLARHSSPAEIRDQIERHATQRLPRIAWLARRHGLIVSRPPADEHSKTTG